MTELREQDVFRRIAVVGPGALGTVFAARIADAGHAEVAVLDHRPDRAARIARDGLVLATDEGRLRTPIHATADVAALGKPELVLVCVKCPALEAAGRSLQALRAPATILTIQNGLGVLEALTSGLAGAAERHALLRGVTYQAANRAADGVVRHVANLPTVIDGSGPRRQAARRAVATLRTAGLPAEVTDDIGPALWRKLVVNAAINPLTALERVANGQVAERKDLRLRAAALATEAARVARAEGVAISDDEAVSTTLDAARQTAGNVSSMRQDIEAGRGTEIAFLGGALLRLALRHGLDLPETRRVTEAVRALSP